MTFTSRILPACLLAAFSGAASAAAFQLWEQNASGIGTAFAGSAAVADNASTLFFNPAGMTRLPGLRLSAGVTGVDANFRFKNRNSNLAGNDGGDAGGGWLAIPNAYFSWQVAPQWFVGLGLSAPFGFKTQYGEAWVGRFHSMKSEIKTLNVNPSLAYQVNDKVALGLGLNYQVLDAEMTNRLGFPGSPMYSLKGDDTAWGWNAGALFTLSPSMRLGLSYRSAMSYTLEGTRSVGPNATPATARIKLPDTLVFSVWQQMSDRWEAMGDLSYTRWSTLGQLNIHHAGGMDTENFNYRNAWRFAWGAAYKINDEWKAKFGIAYDRTPTTDDERSPRVPDNSRIWFSVGGQWRPAKESTVDFGYAYLYLKNPSVSQTRVFRHPVTGAVISAPRLDGHYSDSGHVLGIQYSQGF